MQQTQQHFTATEYELQQQQPQYLGKHDAAVKYMQQLGLHKQNIKVDSEASTPLFSSIVYYSWLFIFTFVMGFLGFAILDKTMLSCWQCNKWPK